MVATPRTPLEKSLTTIWADVLEVRAFGINDNFFDLGGHLCWLCVSLRKSKKRLGKRLPLSALFQAPTVAQLAAAIQKDWTPEWSSLVAINPIEPAEQTSSNAPFFCVHALGGNVLEYRELAQHLGPDNLFMGCKSAGLDGKRPPHIRVADMAAHYIKECASCNPAARTLRRAIAGRSRSLRDGPTTPSAGSTDWIASPAGYLPVGLCEAAANEATFGPRSIVVWVE